MCFFSKKVERGEREREREQPRWLISHIRKKKGYIIEIWECRDRCYLVLFLFTIIYFHVLINLYTIRYVHTRDAVIGRISNMHTLPQEIWTRIIHHSISRSKISSGLIVRLLHVNTMLNIPHTSHQISISGWYEEVRIWWIVCLKSWDWCEYAGTGFITSRNKMNHQNDHILSVILKSIHIPIELAQ